ncbi:ribose 5-phosphate isomerase [Porphyromonas crevioricanis]|uniref:Ribose 5-phosphate isomerase n=2 Tax=Porphyromonas crevioricanis TaxID=393921 RepID=A0A0A2FI94_9PORP|nr:ribose 5-phosphate isomerase B [Porphyromonas crevioricanis]KGN90791.1 ribose 5-phosphate isomerase [Porphyromonas crevioricanis]KGN93965.1 ribose 5-phosphate isomerase [Porphyromonas crevioricanis]SJZ63570.1 ribose 5-phosphate isomerase B [Porphyromonas crevioricanis]SQH72895.1 Ribose-5-phosphate isomerase B [Porphyromonas crevioricanis]GAD04574.1 ribose 5-phosphate isomerase B [Porphyromonas crevioricanis JCM 15906]
MEGKGKTIGLCSDHAGYALKQKVIAQLRDMGYTTKDFGCPSEDRCDYPDYAHPMAQAIQSGDLQVGISICGSGNGISMVMNKYSHIRAALCWSTEIARLARQHNDANVLSLPARFVTEAEARAIVEAFFSTDFEGGRHIERINKIPIH